MTKPTVEELLNDIAVVAIEHGHESHVERVLVALRERLVGEQQATQDPIKVGQKWRECDPRVTRVLTVVGVHGDKIAIRGPKRLSYAQRSRFHGKRGGYQLVASPEPSDGKE